MESDQPQDEFSLYRDPKNRRGWEYWKWCLQQLNAWDNEFAMVSAVGARKTIEELQTLAQQNNLMFGLITELRKFITDAPEDTWGYDSMGDGEVPNGLQTWPRKDEILYNIDTFLKLIATPESTEEIGKHWDEHRKERP